MFTSLNFLKFVHYYEPTVFLLLVNFDRDSSFLQEKTNAADSSEAGGNVEEETCNRTKTNGTSSTCVSDRYNKLQAVQIEIDAVRSALELNKCSENESSASEGAIKEEQEKAEGEENNSQAPSNDKTLQYALASDRLRSLIETKTRLEKEISEASKDGEYGSLIRSIVKEDRNSKRRLKEVEKLSKHQNKRLKRVSLTDDDDFDSVLNAASTGFVKTVSHLQYTSCTLLKIT